MQENILQEYEKVKDKLSEEEFLEEMEKMKSSNEDVEFIDDFSAAQLVVQNHNGVDTSIFENKSEEPSTEMSDELKERFDKVKDQLSEEEFFERIEKFRQQEIENPFMTDTSLADMVVGELVTEEPEVVSEKPEFAIDTIDKLEANSRDVTVAGRVISISNPRSFKTRKGQSGEVQNVELKDNTGEIRAVFWTQNIKLLKNVTEGDIIQIKNVDIKEGYSGLEANLRPRSVLVHLEEDSSKYPAYEEEITKIADIQPETKVNIIARIIRIPTIRSYEKNGKEGKVASLELQDDSGQISYTLWNKNVELINDLKLEDGDTVKILQAQARERPNRDGENEITLTHWDGRIIKGDYDVPEIQQEFLPIGDLSEQKDVSIIGVVSRLQDIRVFTRKTDNTEGKLRNFDVRDSTGEIRVTVWGDDTNIVLNKGDFIKVIGGDVRYDQYTQSQYSMNTNFNTQITVNPDNLSIDKIDELDGIRNELHPVSIGQIQFDYDEDGIEIDIIGRILSLEEPREFQRDDSSVGIVRSALFADESGKVRLSFWNEKAEGDYAVGEAYRIENARTRLGMYSVDLNIGGGSRIIRLSEEQASAMFIPELATLEKAIYDYKKIEDLDEDEEDTIIVGRVIELNDIRNFDRDNGDTGFVRNIEIADDTGSIRVVLWDNDAKMDLEMGQPLKLQNPRLSLDMDNRLQATVSGGTTILEPSEKELEELPSQEELMESIFVAKPIEALLEDDTNVHITARIKEVFTDRILLKKCPNCRENVEESEDEYICDNCGHTFDEPDYTLMIPTRVEDDTGEIPVTFFGKLAEELIEKDMEEIISLIDDGYGIEDKLEDLVGMTIEIIANVSFNEYSEENRLNPKKLLKKYY
ncbi:OB-fold nucleic acid binding domain-containing protein [Methanobrevibacter sp.]|uniref:OB-fold nucleic acid binding domain-containing protein n=1 Tax=Methanobrevibacter sp. TaxID=66852 RepID=UPI002E796327|nr:OB-fold nucleic acid binding domain-containing protein [Methanobrevibacter sp.]MEE1335551.1 OB-fold nucleic acid binding domain-containing protein [Methanobrevibacter sp.]